jgi:hypothetical protein
MLYLIEFSDRLNRVFVVLDKAPDKLRFVCIVLLAQGFQ